MENRTKIDDLGAHLSQETSICDKIDWGWFIVAVACVYRIASCLSHLGISEKLGHNNAAYVEVQFQL
jgi:hypothetical protein